MGCGHVSTFFLPGHLFCSFLCRSQAYNATSHCRFAFRYAQQPESFGFSTTTHSLISQSTTLVSVTTIVPGALLNSQCIYFLFLFIYLFCVLALNCDLVMPCLPTECTDDSSFTNAVGGCSSYGAGGINQDFCAVDGVCSICCATCFEETGCVLPLTPTSTTPSFTVSPREHGRTGAVIFYCFWAWDASIQLWVTTSNCLQHSFEFAQVCTLHPIISMERSQNFQRRLLQMSSQLEIGQQTILCFPLLALYQYLATLLPVRTRPASCMAPLL